MIIRSKAPLRIGLAGSGTDLDFYSNKYGGAILNATINLFAYAVIKPRDDGKIVLHAVDRNQRMELPAAKQLEIDGKLDILKGVYNRIVRDFADRALSFELTTYVDAPAGSGLGSSSTLVVAIIGAFVEWLKLPLGEYDIAHLAFEIERKDLEMAGGKQDQYAATFGGFNFMEFYDNDKVIVNPLRIKTEYLHELEFNLILYFIGTSRVSSRIIEAQIQNVTQKNETAIEAMHKLKEQAFSMKEIVLLGKLNEMGNILDFGWRYKKQTAPEISNQVIDDIYEEILKAGATGGKISGAGGGGFMMFYCPETSRFPVIDKLTQKGGVCRKFQFTQDGLRTWSSE